MPLTNPRPVFGMHQCVIRDKSTLDQSLIRVIGDFELNFSSEMKKLEGGSNSFPWATAPGVTESTFSVTIQEYSLSALKYFGGFGANSFTENLSGDATGFASALTNLKGSSVFSATTGVASASVLASTNPVFGDYLVKAASANTVNVYLNNDLDGVAFIDDSLKINSSPLTITAAGNVTIPGTNIQLTGGSGTIALTVGDVARFSVRPKNSYNYEYNIGAAGAVFPEFELDVIFEKAVTSEANYNSLYLPRVKANGFSFSGQNKEFASFETELTILYDSGKGYAAKYRSIGLA